MYAVQIGAGKIGRGFIGQLLYQSGFHTTFVDNDAALVSLLNTQSSYRLYLVHEFKQCLEVENYDALHVSQNDAVAAAIAQADWVSTSVGASQLATLAPLLATGIMRRLETHARPLNILLCENTMQGKAILDQGIRAVLPENALPYYDTQVALLNTFTGRMAPTPLESELAADPLRLIVEPCNLLYYDADAVRGGMPVVQHVTPKANFDRYTKEKLFVHMMGHSTAGYLGHHLGYRYIWQAIRDPYIRETVETCTLESCRGMIEYYHTDPSELVTRRADFIYRYHNRILNDGVHRVAQEPIRKLGPNERFLGAARHCLEAGETPTTIALAAASAIHYYHPEDEESSRLGQVLQGRGIHAVLEEICGLQRSEPLFDLLLQANDKFLHSTMAMTS